jgi:hypothetical protein
VATILAILAGGYWFLQQRLNKPNIKLEQTVTQRPVANDPKSILITLDVSATNIGKVEVKLEPSKAEIRELNPPGEDISMSVDLKPMRLEPGESDQAVFKTLIVPSTVRTIQVHSQYAVPHTKNYWSLLSAKDLGVGEAKTDSATSAP